MGRRLGAGVVGDRQARRQILAKPSAELGRPQRRQGRQRPAPVDGLGCRRRRHRPGGRRLHRHGLDRAEGRRSGLGREHGHALRGGTGTADRRPGRHAVRWIQERVFQLQLPVEPHGTCLCAGDAVRATVRHALALWGRGDHWNGSSARAQALGVGRGGRRCGGLCDRVAAIRPGNNEKRTCPSKHRTRQHPCEVGLLKPRKSYSQYRLLAGYSR